ncbi:hypothetical protein [Anaeromusa acidaminophila]|uniref:hypothetical protein n=1 Tax=Anaeromusa acidaminophila TaxID=81464 RepID=UPI00036FE663|nr:hypothetical protein [Anaeromusa acidaminophila]
METRICPETGQEMTRGTKLITLTYKGFSEEVEMPGWYTEDKDHGIHSSEDMKVSDSALLRLKARANKPKEQAWFWSQEWQRGEKAVQKELTAKGPGKAYTSAELLAEFKKS